MSTGQPSTPTGWLRRRFTTTHWLDDPLGDTGLFTLAAGIQLWSTAYMWKLTSWVYGDAAIGLVNVLFYDIAGLLALRVALDRRWTTTVRRLGGWIAAACFAITFAGNLLAHHTLTNAGAVRAEHTAAMAQAQKWIGDGLGALPVLLLVALTVLEAMRKRYRKDVLAREAHEAERRAAAAAREESRTEPVPDPPSEQDTQPLPVTQPRPEPEPEPEPEPSRELVLAPAPSLADRYPARPDEGLMDRAKRIAESEFRAGRDVTGPDLERAVGAGKSTGRKAIAAVIAAGVPRPGERPPLAAVAS